MDTFGSNTNAPRALVKDTLTTGKTAANKQPAAPKPNLTQGKDSFSVSSRDISNIVATLKANNVTDINAIKDYVTSTESVKSSNFTFDSLSDTQVRKLISAVRANIAENVAEVIYSTKNNNTILEMSSKERAHIDNVLGKLRNSQITSMSQAIDFVQRHSENNPGLLAKVSGRLTSLVHQNTQETPNIFNSLRQDSYTPAISIEQRSFTNPFKGDVVMRQGQQRSPAEAKEFLSNIFAANSNATNKTGNPQGATDMSNVILAGYLRGKTTPEMRAEELSKKGITSMAIEDQVWYQEKVAHSKVSFINDIAAKIAADKARVIITCRIVGEVGGATAAALGMASLAGATPIIGIIGAFAMTMVASVLGFIVGKAAGEGMGKIITNTNFDGYTPEEYERIQEEIHLLEDERERQERESRQSAEEETEEDEAVEEETNSTNNTGFFSNIDNKVSQALKSRVIYKK